MARRAVSFRVVVGIWFWSTILGGAASHSAEPIPLRAGPVSMIFDADNAFLRYVKVGPHEILRGINAPVRNSTWGTVSPKVSNITVDNHGDHFTVTFDAVCRDGDIDFRWRGKLSGTQTGEIEFSFDGEAHATFQRNRIGMCVLHPASAAGKPWIIKHTDGRESKGGFPTHISPHQPAKAIRAIAHEVAKGVWAHVELEGEVFEMEDQRNWTDASFKTYCTPLELPFPVKVENGTNSHKIRIRIDGEVPKASASDDRVVLTLGKTIHELPHIGLQASSDARGLSPRQVERLKELRLDHLRVDLNLSGDAFAEKLREANAQAKALGVPLHVGIRLDDKREAALEHLVAELKNAKPNVALYVIHVADWRQFQPARKTLEEVRREARLAACRGPNFVDLNRDRPKEEGLDVVTFPINPQIHAFDDASIIETLPIQAETALSAKQFVGNRKLAVGPITLRPPVVEAGAGGADNRVPADIDPRQPSRFVAAWTLGSIKYLAEAGVPTVTYYETVGRKGIMNPERSAGDAANPAALDDVFPTYHVFRELASFAGGQVQWLDSSDPLAVVGLALANGGQRRMLVANLTARPQTVAIRGIDAPAKVSTLIGDVAPSQAPAGAKADKAGSDVSFALPAHSIIRVDLAVK